MPNWKVTEEKFKALCYGISYADAESLLKHYGYSIDTKGKTSGSRIRFVCEGHNSILLHKPHPQKELKDYVIKQLHDTFEQEGFWNE